LDDTVVIQGSGSVGLSAAIFSILGKVTVSNC
jgi:threonine dehydrogenase-like Zn-dependent dehydrogenase